MKRQFFGHASVLLMRQHEERRGSQFLPLLSKHTLLSDDVRVFDARLPRETFSLWAAPLWHPFVPAEDQIQTGEVKLCHRRLWRGAGTLGSHSFRGQRLAPERNERKHLWSISVFRFHHISTNWFSDLHRVAKHFVTSQAPPACPPAILLADTCNLNGFRLVNKNWMSKMSTRILTVQWSNALIE